MKQDIIHTVIYYRKPTKEELAAGAPKRMKTYITVPVEKVFLGVGDRCQAILSPSIIGNDGLRYYFKCVNLAELL